MIRYLSQFDPVKNNYDYHDCIVKCLENVFFYKGIEELNSTILEGLNGGLCYTYTRGNNWDPAENSVIEVKLNFKPQIVEILSRLGVKITKTQSESQNLQWQYVKKLFRLGEPVILFVNSYYLNYSKDYLIRPGGIFNQLRSVVLTGIDEEKRVVKLLDPSENNFYGELEIEALFRAWCYPEGLEKVEINSCLYVDTNNWMHVTPKNLCKIIVAINMEFFYPRKREDKVAIKYSGISIEEELVTLITASMVGENCTFKENMLLWLIFNSKKKLCDWISLLNTISPFSYSLKLTQLADSMIVKWNYLIKIINKANKLKKPDVWQKAIATFLEIIEIEKKIGMLLVVYLKYNPSDN